MTSENEPKEKLLSLPARALHPKAKLESWLDGLVSHKELTKNGWTIKDIPPNIINSDLYEIEGYKDRGSHGVIFIAQDKITGERVAIKMHHPTKSAREQLKYRNITLEEAEKKEKLPITHFQNIMPTQLVFDKNGLSFFVMPYHDTFLSDVLDDGNERRSLKNGGLSLEEITTYSSGIYNGLIEAREKLGRVHADLKPENIALKARGGQPLISDWGIATIVGEKDKDHPRDNMGERLVRSPRLFLEGQSPNYNSDLFSLGSMVYRMITGFYPFEDELIRASKNSASLQESSKNFITSLLSEGTNELDTKKVSKLIDKKLSKIQSFQRHVPKRANQYAVKIIKLLLSADLDQRGYIADRDLRKYFREGIVTMNKKYADIFTSPDMYSLQNRLNTIEGALKSSKSIFAFCFGALFGMIATYCSPHQPHNNGQIREHSKMEEIVQPEYESAPQSQDITKKLKHTSASYPITK